ncbi:unnamed protein product [Tilletia controversa]|uniref:Uncharacterized protein n=2 Tax=Tilletia TaxID=13289 RepID=A0A177V5X1_9BASI|nr:hypothetical protein CF336_g6708 [Tilletia laevis]KAE8253650.1 hypothetical protein A4X03_0g5835 [Tilletia caries]CAD6949509.1 unnamed protein product [Tilletia controversa]KAE8195641.1 hypothetical protein CF335_g5048 [Tilletia laevis]CAD6889056.1 unnamed protein product [Tilletia caries]
MQLKLAFIAAAVVLATSALAAADVQSNEGIVVRSAAGLHTAHGAAAPELVARASKAHFETKAAAAANHADKLIKTDLIKFEQLSLQSKVSKKEAHLALSAFNEHLLDFGMKFQKLAAEHKGNKARSLEQRQAILQPAIANLSKSLNQALPKIRKLARHLTTNLGLNTVSVIVGQITPGLKQVDLGLEAILKVVADDAGPTLVDPLLHVVYGLLDGLGLNLNARDAPVERAQGKVAVKKEIGASLNLAGVHFAADTKQVKILLGQTKVTLPEFKHIIRQVNGHASAATTEFTRLHALSKKAELNARAQPGELALAVNNLLTDLDRLTPVLYKLVKQALKDLELNTVNKLIAELKPTLASLYLGLEALLRGLGAGLAPLVDPLLATVDSLTKALGLDLNNDTGKL